MDELQQRVQRRRHLLDFGEHVCGAMRFRNLRIRQSFDELHLGGRLQSAPYRPVEQ